MARTTSTARASMSRVAAALGAAALASVGVVGTDIPASVVAAASPVHVSSTPAVLGGTTTASTAPSVTTVTAEAGATSPAHVGRLA